VSESPSRPARTISDRAAGIAWWLGPVVFLFVLYRRGLNAWFAADDFAWLSLLRQVNNFHDLFRVMFRPEAQGTVRFLSERGFYLLFEKLFGLDNVPFRICVFITMASSLALVAWITVRITGSRMAGFLAPVLWTANTSLALVMTWTAAWNEALCSLFLISALSLFIRWAETGRRSFWWWQLVVFTLGFGALELNVVYPALAAAYALFVAAPSDRRRLLLSLIPPAGISCAYFILHRAAAPFPGEGPYAVRIDGRIFHTFWIYLQAAFVPQNWVGFGHTARSGEWLVALIGLPFAAFCIRQLTHRRRKVAFFLCWFVVALAPMLVLPDHLTEYYVMIPAIGLAIAGAWGISIAWQSAPVLRVAAMFPLVAYLAVMIPSTRTAVNWWVDRVRPIRGLVLGVAEAQQSHPGKIIVLDGITSQLWDDAVGASAFYSLRIDNVYLTPESRDSIHPMDNAEGLAQMVLDPAVMRAAITHDQVVVYSEVGDHLRNVTRAYERSAPGHAVDSVPRRVEIGNPLFGYLLGPEWSPPETGFRWMPRRATLELGGPGSAKDRLLIEGFCPALQLRGGPLHLSVTVDGIPLEGSEITDPESSFRRLMDIPPQLAGKKAVLVEISVDRTTRGPDGRELGLVVNRISMEPE